ncbi:MAG: hypothetical protein KAT62_11020 [Desulfuromonadales bacterium]|nr:hypothetical protein [Chloroflexota bacterium]MCK4622729.1 hypothetical protein [Desulfuromonadales bacterium]
MSMTKNIFTLIILLLVVAAVISGIHYLGSQVDNKSKYTHPITRPGARW